MKYIRPSPFLKKIINEFDKNQTHLFILLNYIKLYPNNINNVIYKDHIYHL